jgi:hypothetical protein
VGVNWLRQLRARRQMADDLAAEIRQHLEEKVAALMGAGMSRAAAERLARREFGNVTLLEERSREVWRWPALDAVGADLRFALRQVRRSPGFAATAVLILALGVGINSAMFSLVRHVPSGWLRSGRAPTHRAMTASELPARISSTITIRTGRSLRSRR